MKRTLLFLSAVAIASILNGCSKSDKSTTKPPDPEPLSETFTGSISGQIFDELGQALEGATVKCGDLSTTTDVNGLFSITNAIIYRTAGRVTVEKAGYLKTTRAFTVIDKSKYFVSFRLIKKNLVAATFDAASGGTITLSSGATITFEPGAILDASNARYTGTVTVNTQSIDPAAADFNETTPGSELGKTKKSAIMGIRPVALMYVELLGAANQPLQLDKTIPATLRLPIAPEDFESAPPALQLSSFDHNSGLWVEEGVATKQLYFYLGKVTHFSFWNFHTGYNPVPVTGVVKKLNNETIPAPLHSQFTYTHEGKQYQIASFTDTAGVFKLMLPQNAKGILKIITREGNQLYSGEVGPYGVEKKLDTIRVNDAPPPVIVPSNK